MKKSLIVFALSALVFSACGGSFDEKQSFIDASVESACSISDLESLTTDEGMKQYYEIFEDYGFDVSDDDAMNELFDKYSADEEVNAAIEDGISECFSDVIDGLITE